MLYYAVVVWQMNATKGWDRKKVVIEHATKRFGKDEKIQIILSEFSQLRCGLCSLRFAADKYIVK